MDNKQLFTRFEYLPTSAVLKNNTKCVDVVLVYKQHVVTKSLYIPNKSGMKSSDFVDEAKKLINKQLNSGELEAYAEAQIKKEKKKKKGLIVCFSCLGVIALAGGAGVATYYFLRHKGPEVKVSIPKIDGLKFTNTRAYAGEDFDTKITIDTSKTDGKVLPDTLKKVESGNRVITDKEYTYSITDEVKENAKLHIPGQYVEADITISLELVNPTPDTNDYLTFTSLTDNSEINIKYFYSIDDEGDTKYGYHAPNLEFSKDDGKTWTDVTSKLPSTDGESVTILDNIKTGDKIMFRGDNNTEKGFNYVVDCDLGEDDTEWNEFMFYNGENDEFSVSGNIMSLIKKTNFANAKMPADGCFADIFYKSSIVDASELVLPSEGLTKRCFCDMFMYSKITNAPKLNATTLAPYCYQYMFDETPIATLPAIPSTSLAEHCYEGMFYGCQNITSVPDNYFTATTLKTECYSIMFAHSGLVTPPVLPNATLAPYCYDGMFYECYKLTSVPRLDSMNLEEGCYSGMFRYCRSLTEVPYDLLPATTLKAECYGGMFEDCVNLVSTPKLPATTLAAGCYAYMFDNCRSLQVTETDNPDPQNKIFTCPGTIPTEAVDDMFDETAGPFEDSTPSSGKTYYFTIPAKYTVTCLDSTDATLGTVRVDCPAYYVGNTVFGTVYPDEGCEIPVYYHSILVYADSGFTTSKIGYDNETGEFNFDMPEENIYVGAICHRAANLNIFTTCQYETCEVPSNFSLGDNITITFKNPTGGHHIATELSEFLDSHHVYGDYYYAEDDMDYSYSGGVGTLTIEDVGSGFVILGSAPEDY